MLGVVVRIDGYDPVAKAPVSLFASSHDEPSVCHMNGQIWWPALAKLPTLRYDLFDGAFSGRITAPASSLTMSAEPWPNFGRYSLAAARIRLWTGEVGAPWAAWTLRFDGRLSGQPKVADGQAQVDFAVDDSWLDTALLPTYAGTTGAEGPAELKGQAKPLAIGRPRYVPGVLIDSVNSVFQVSRGTVAAIDAALERLVRFGLPVADYPTYAALVAATIPRGGWATARAVGLARFGAPPTGQVSFMVAGDNAGGWARRPGQVIRLLAEMSGGAGRIAGATLDALDAARPYDLSLYLDQQTTARELIQSLAASVNAVAGVSWTGQLFVVPVALAEPTITLAADGSSLPPVGRIEQVEIATPWQKLAIAAERAWSVHALKDVAFTAELIDRGRYDPAETYREGHIVDLADGSRWLYVSTTPGSSMPASDNPAWALLSGPVEVAWDSIADPNGTKPADNADVTGENTAKDTQNVGGRPVDTLLQAADQSLLRTLEQMVQADEMIREFDGRAIETAARVEEARSEAEAANTSTGERVVAAELALDKAVQDLADEIARAQGADEDLERRIDSIAVSGGYDDTDVRALIQTAQTARADGDRAIGQRVDSIVTDYQDRDGKTNTRITQQGTALSSADRALGERVDSIVTDYQGRDVRTNSRVTTEVAALSDANQALARRIDTIVTEGTYDDTSVRAEISRVETAAVDRDTALGQRVDGILASGGGGSTNDAIARAEVQRVEQASVTRDSALGRRVDDIITDYQDRDVKTNARVTGEVQALAGTDAALSLRIDGVVADYQNRDVNTNARIGSEIVTLASADEAISRRVDDIVADYQSRDVKTNARVSSVATAVTDGRFAAASTVQTLQSNYGTLQSTVTFQAGTIAGIEERTAAYIQLGAKAGDDYTDITFSAIAGLGAGWRLRGNGLITDNVVFRGILDIGSDKTGERVIMNNRLIQVVNAAGVAVVKIGIWDE